MSKRPPNIAQIDEYLSGEISPEQLPEFEKRLREETQMQNDVRLTKKVIEGIDGHAFKKMLKKIHEKINDDSRDDAPSS